jgi:hypothetical protein
MALRCLSVVVALSTLVATGCRTQSNYRPAPTVVAVTPVAPPPCATPVPVPPPPGVLIPVK